MQCNNCKNSIEELPCKYCGYDGKEILNPHYLPCGQELGQGKYIIGRVLGAGGFGVTYSALDKVLNRRVAIKEYMPGEFSTRMQGNSHLTVFGGEKEEQFKAGMAKFYDESVRLSKFTEVQGIVQVYDCFYENNTAYIVMEYLEGETLDQLIKRESKIPVEDAVKIATKVLEALCVVHEAGMIHRDIAPNNIFLTSDGKVKLLDFGAARTATGSHSKSLTVMYKEGFTAEEQYRSNGDQGTWTDVYSVAATLYKSITGITPEGAMERKLRDELKPVGKCGADVPKNVETAIMNALNVNPKKRTQTAEQFMKELNGSVNVKNRFERTRESKIARFPKSVAIAGGIIIIASVMVLVLQQMGILSIHFETFTNLFVPEGKVRMMNVVNMDEDEAKERLEQLGLVMEREELRYDNQISPGRIISQNVKKGELVDAGTIVGVVVSSESVRVAVPDIVGLNLEDAETLLSEQALKWDVVQENSIYPVNTVIGCDPEEKKWMYQGDTVSLTVSAGMELISDNDYQLADLTGMTEDDARALLAENGVYLNVIGTEASSTVAEGRVIQQTEKPGDVIHGGSTVNVIISSGKPLVSMPNVIGMTEADAKEVIREAGLSVTVSYLADMESELGTVIDQNAKEGAEITEGTTVEIFLPRRLDTITLGTIHHTYGPQELYYSDEPNVPHIEIGEDITSTYHCNRAIVCTVESRFTGPYTNDDICRLANGDYSTWPLMTNSFRTDDTFMYFINIDETQYKNIEKLYCLVLGLDRTGNVVAYTQFEIDLS